MRLITGPRRGGKTTEAIKIASRENAVLLTHTRDAASQAREMAYEMGHEIDVGTYYDLVAGRLEGRQQAVVIDNVEYFIRHVAAAYGAKGVPAVTMTPGVRVNLATREGYS